MTDRPTDKESCKLDSLALPRKNFKYKTVLFYAFSTEKNEYKSRKKSSQGESYKLMNVPGWSVFQS